MTQQLQDFNGYTEGQAIPSDFGQATPGTFWIINGTMTAQAASAYEGTRGAAINSAVGLVAITQSYSITTGVRAAVSFAIRFPGGLTDGGQFGQVADTLTLGSVGSRLVFQYGNSGTTVTVNGPTIAPAQWVYVQMAATLQTGATSRFEGRIYTISGGTVTLAASFDTGPTVTANASTSKVMRWGRVNGGGPQAIDFDVVGWDNAAATGYPGTLPVSTLTGGIKVWNGSAWIVKPVKVWNGSSWVVKPVKRWDGTGWVLTP